MRFLKVCKIEKYVDQYLLNIEEGDFKVWETAFRNIKIIQ